MSDTPKTDALFFPYGRDATAAASPSLLVCMTQFEILERENAAQLAELHRISEALGTNEGHSSVTHIEILKGENAALREQLKDCSAAFDRQQKMLDRNAEQIAALREQIKWVLHELKTAADRLTDCQQTTISARDCIGRVEAAMKEEGK